MQATLLKPMVAQIRERFTLKRQAGYGSPPIMRSFESAASYLERLADAIIRIDGDKDYSEIGKKKAILGAAASGIGGITQAAIDLRDADNELRARRRRLVMGEPIDPKDAVAAIRREGIRTWLRELEPTQRLAALASTTDPLVIQAAIESPEMIGLSVEAVHDIAERRHTEGNGDAVPIDEELEMVEVTAQLVDISKQTILDHAPSGPDGVPDIPGDLIRASGFVQTSQRDFVNNFLRAPTREADHEAALQGALNAPAA